MKKYKLLYFILVAVAIIPLGCTSIEDYPDGRLSFDQIFQNQKLVGGYMNSCYGSISGSTGDNYTDKTFLAAACDEAHDVGDVTNGAMYQWVSGFASAFDNSLASPEKWDYYSPIRKCNIMIAKIDSANMYLEDQRESYKGEAYGLRAFYYLQMIKNYGGVPLILDNASEDDYDYSKLSRSTFSECALQIISDCRVAISNKTMGWHSGSSDKDRYRWSKAMSAAVMSEAALFAASPLNNDGTLDWNEAAVITKNALDSCLANGYALYTATPEDASATAAYGTYDLYFMSAADVKGQADPETIMTGRNQLAIWGYCGLPVTLGQTRAGSCPSQELVDSYETTDGKSPILGYEDEDHLHPIINPDATLYDENNPYANRDPRLVASIYYNGAPLTVGDSIYVETYEGGNCALSSTSKRNTRTGYYMRKFGNPTSDKNGNNDGYFRIFRLAELYLNYAEALNEASSSMAPDAAVDAVNTVRARVGMPAIPYGLTKEEFRKKVRNERRVEFAFEEQRFYDVRRWMILDSTDKVVTGMKATTDGKYERFVVNRRKAYSDKYLRFPIPGDEAIRLKTQTGLDFQNPGWE
ncbi:MAG: RagB/SusD family nutrient uptake outer membrane protein [Paludibacter sp.]|nr:RagB/SusD family nutrient uptake outer membrane protein [Paludibacter sp.]